MEENIFKHNQRRVATACYLGEIYNYRLISSGIIFEQLWSFATFGHPNGRPWPGQIAPLDAPDDYFRIRLICTLLDTCGVCFDRGALRRKLDDFLVYLNYYVLCKEQPLPMDVEFMLTETLETLRPELKFKKSFPEALEALEEMVARNKLPSAQTEAEVEDESDGHNSSDGGDGKRRRNTPRNEVAVEGSEDDDDSDSSSSSSSSDSSGSSGSSSSSGSDSEDSGSGSASEDGADTEDEEDEISRHRQDEELALRKEADDEFDRELAKMMAELGSSSSSAPVAPASTNVFSRNHSHNVFSRSGLPSASTNHSHGHSHPHPGSSGLSEIGLPIKKKLADNQSPALAQSGSNDGHMKFSLLSKKGSKQVTHEVNVPSTASIAINTRTKQLKEEAERKQRKELVLAYERSSGHDQQLDLPPYSAFHRRPPQQQQHSSSSTTGECQREER